MNFGGKVVIITGSGRGIGACTAKLFAKYGAQVIVNDIDAIQANEIASYINNLNDKGKAHAIVGDISEKKFPERLMHETKEIFGKIDILVNNAGYTWDGVLHKMSDDQWESIIHCHGTGCFRVIRAAAPYMREAAKKEISEGLKPKDRCIINVSSTSGLHGNAGQSNYSFAKMGLIGLTKTVAKEWGPFGIRCNAVAFGFIDTRLTQPVSAEETVHVGSNAIPQGLPTGAHSFLSSQEFLKLSTPLGRFGTAHEAASSVILMASPLASYITGHTLEVTGGMGM